MDDRKVHPDNGVIQIIRPEDQVKLEKHGKKIM